MLTTKRINIFSQILHSISILSQSKGDIVLNHAGLQALFPNGISGDDYLTPDKLRDGVSIDPTFVVPRPNACEKFHSSPGCPSPIDGFPWVKYGSNPAKCYLVGFQGPCPPNMKIFIKPQSEFGYCQCDCFQDDPNTPFELFCHKTPTSDATPPGLFLESYTYYEPTGLCYKLFSEGPCKFGDWLKMDFGKSPPAATCTKRRCPYPKTDQYETIFYSSNASSCHTVRDNCGSIFSNFDAPKQFRYFFVDGSWIPKCVEFSPAWAASGGTIAQYECQKHETFSKLLDRCLKSFNDGEGIC